MRHRKMHKAHVSVELFATLPEREKTATKILNIYHFLVVLQDCDIGKIGFPVHFIFQEEVLN